MMSTELVAIKLGASPAVAKALEDACIKYGITTMLQKAHFLGQMAQESMGYTKVSEVMGYSAKRLSEVWPGRYAKNGVKGVPNDKAIALAKAGPKAIANDVYGSRMGNERDGINDDDGWDFRGQGYKMITGFDNVLAYSMDTYGDDRVVKDPTMLQRLPDSVYSGGWFWKKNGAGVYADRNDHLSVGRIINIGNVKSKAMPIGHSLRVLKTNLAIAAFKEMTQ